MVLEVHVLLCVTEPDFFCPKNGENGSKMGQKQGFWNLSKNLVIIFFLNLVYKENSHYLLYPCTNPILVKNLVPEKWVKCSWPIRLQDFLIDYISRTK